MDDTRRPSTPALQRRAACAQCPSIAPCVNCNAPGQSCRQIFRPSGDCATCPTNICVGSPPAASSTASSTSGSGSKSNPGAIVGPVAAVGGTLLIASIFIAIWWKRRKTKRANRARLRADAKLRDAKAKQFTVGSGAGSNRSPSSAGHNGPQETEWTELRTDGLQAYQPQDPQQQEIRPNYINRRNSTGAATHLSRITEGQEDDDARSTATHRYSQLSRRSRHNPFDVDGREGAATPEVPPLPPMVHRAIGAPMDALQGRSGTQRVPLRNDVQLDYSVHDAAEEDKRYNFGRQDRSTWRLSTGSGGGVGREPFSPAAPSTARSRHFDRDDIGPPLPPLPTIHDTASVNTQSTSEDAASTSDRGYYPSPRIVTLGTPTTYTPPGRAAALAQQQQRQHDKRESVDSDPFKDERAIKRSSANHRRGSYNAVGSQDSQLSNTSGSQGSSRHTGDGEGEGDESQSFISATNTTRREGDGERRGGRSIAGETFGRPSTLSRASTAQSGATTTQEPQVEASYLSLPPIPSLPPLSGSTGATDSPGGQEIITFAQQSSAGSMPPSAASDSTITPAGRSGQATATGTGTASSASPAWGSSLLQQQQQQAQLQRSDTTASAKSGVSIPFLHESSGSHTERSGNALPSGATQSTAPSSYPSSYSRFTSPRDDVDDYEEEADDSARGYSRPPSNWRGSHAATTSAGWGLASRSNSQRNASGRQRGGGGRSPTSSIGGLSVLDGFDWRVADGERGRGEDVPPVPPVTPGYGHEGRR